MQPIFLIPAERGDIPTLESQYEGYKYQVLASQGLSLEDVLQAIDNYRHSNDYNLDKPLVDLLHEWEVKWGVNGSAYLSYDAWLDEMGTRFYAILEENGWTVKTKSQNVDKTIVWYTIEYAINENITYSMMIRGNNEAEDFLSAKNRFDSDEWVKDYILQHKTTTLYKVSELLDYAFNIQCKFTSTFEDLKDAGLV